MKTYKQLRRARKLKKFGKKVGIAILFLGISYLLSLLSFYIYTQLSQILQPVEKGFLGFAIIGLIAGLVAVLVSFLNKKLILTVVISFAIDCLVDSVILYSKLGTQVVQYLPGLLVSMSSVIASWHFLKIKLWSPKNSMQVTREQFNKKYALARKLLENPSKLTLDVFMEACEALQGINPKIDRLLNEADHISRTISFLSGGNPIGLTVSLIPVKTEKDKEKKEKLLFFIDLVNDIWDEVKVAYVRLNAGNPGNYVDHPVREFGNTLIASSGPSGLATISMAFVVATSVVAANNPSIGSIFPKNDNRIPETRDSQEIIVPTPTAIPTILPTVTPKIVQVLTYSTVEKTIFVSALEEGITYTAGSTGTYRFTITGGAYLADPNKGWEAKVMIYKNRQIDWSGNNETHTNWTYLVGFPGDRDPNEKLTREQAEPLGKGQKIDIFLNKNDYLIFIVFDSKGDFGDNSGGMYVQVQKGIVSTQTVPATSATSAITVDSEWGHFTRIFSGPPDTNPTSVIDYTTIAMYVTVHNNGTTDDRIIGGASSACNNITFDDMSLSGPDGTIPNIVIPAKSTVAMNFMKAGRIMCNGVKGISKEGDRFTVGLIFEKYGKVPVIVEVRAGPE
jgi:copper(I)-binding protein